MGQTTPYLSIYLPSAGEKNYQQAFDAGMMNVDQHDHSGGPNKGVPIQASGLANFSVTYEKLASNVANISTGIGTEGAPFQNRLILLGILSNFFALGAGGGVGFVAMNGSTVAARTFQDTGRIAWTNANGVSGNPSADLVAPVTVPYGGTGKTAFDAYRVVVGGTSPTNELQTVNISGATAGDVLSFVSSTDKPIWSTLQKIFVATLTITDTQFQSLNTVPIDIVSAPGVGKILVPLRLIGLLNYAGVSQFSGLGTVYINYQISSSQRVMAFGSDVFTGNTTRYFYADFTIGATTQGFTPSNIENLPLIVQRTTSATNGTGNTVDFWLQYTILDVS